MENAVGFPLLKFDDFFNFDVGDVFEYYTTYHLVDPLYFYNHQSPGESYQDMFFTSYYSICQENFGVTETYASYYHGGLYHRELRGYVKNGDTTGIISPDGVLLDVKEIEEPASSISLFPNPAIDYIQLVIPKEIDRFSNVIYIYNQHGQLVKSLFIDQGLKPGNMTISIEELPLACYTLVIPAESKIIRARFVVI